MYNEHSAFDLTKPNTLKLDLSNQKPKDVLAIHEAFVADMKAKPELGPLPVRTGWHDVTPEIAINLLRRNRPGANRWLDPATVFYYADQMARNDWKATGQGILVDKNGRLIDAQHRLYAVVISGATIKSFVVTDIEPEEDLFAYIDNAKARSPAAALQTAGFNGVASVIAKVLRFAEEVRYGVYNPSGATKLARMSPAQILKLPEGYPNAQRAARSVASDWSEAAKYLGGRKDMVAYVGMRIMDEHDEYIADDFFEAVMEEDDTRESDHPIAALRKEIDKDAKAKKQMRRHHLAAILILAFNAWYLKQTMPKRWVLAVTEDFPALVKPVPQAEAAE
jgi:hypothetical protein